MKDIVVRKSRIDGNGVFAQRDFSDGEIVLKWNPKPINKKSSDELSKEEKNYVAEIDGKLYLMNSPERFINHSCEPNTEPRENRDIAIKEIKKGEEITTSYKRTGGFIDFDCKCNSRLCKGSIR